MSSTERLQDELAAHDGENWLHPEGFRTDCHNFTHLVKTAGKIAAHLEDIDDRRAPEDTELDPTVVADLIIEALRFANNHGFDAGTATAERLEQLRERHQAQAVQGQGT